MAQIGRGSVTNVWQNLEDVIEGFSPEVDSQYQLQNIGARDLLIYEGAEAPTGIDGFVVGLHKVAKLTKKSADEYWFVRALTDTTVLNLGTL